MITDIEDFFTKGCGRCAKFDTPDCTTKLWAEGIADLRRICLDEGLVETVKWGHPCYMHADRNLVIMGTFLDNFRLTFFKAALMKDPEGIMVRQGENTQHPDMIKFTNNAGVKALEPTIRAYIQEAKSYADAGIVPEKVVREVDMPDELLEVLDADPELAEAFAALTPGRQKSYAFNLNQAKSPATRYSRIEKFRDKIFAGKGAMERL